MAASLSPSPEARRAAREAFVRMHFTACHGEPRRLALLAVNTGFYSPKIALCQIAWRFERTIKALIDRP